MNIFNLIPLALAIFLCACSSESSSGSTNASAEGAQRTAEVHSSSSTESSSSSNVSYGIVPIDTTNQTGSSQDVKGSVDDMTSMTSSSKTSCRFTTEAIELYGSDDYIFAYYEENGVQGLLGCSKGSVTVTYRILWNSDSSESYVGWLISGAYWSKNCVRDSAYFTNRCAEENGELVDYNNGCEINNLQLSCVSPYKTSDIPASLKSFGKDLHDWEAACEDSSDTSED